MKSKDTEIVLEGDAEPEETQAGDESLSHPETGEASQNTEETPDQILEKRDEYLELWKRAQADYKNLRRRGQADLEAGIRRNMQPLLDSLLLVLDHLDMALTAPTPTEETRNFAIGVQMTRDQLLSALLQEQVLEITTDGEFDPELHQAVEMVTDSDSEPGNIVETVRKGYSWRGVVLRFAQVKVAASDETAEDPQPETESSESN